MNTADLEISHSLELEIWINNKKTTLLTKVEKVVDNTVLMTPIRINGQLVGFPPTCTVNLLYPTEEHVYVWVNVQIKAVKFQKEVYHCVTLKEDASTINRRGSYRVYIGEEMLVTTFTNEGPKPLRAMVKDISEGGFAFLSTEEFDIGRTVRLNLHTKKNQELHLTAQIVRQQPGPRNTETLYGCKFRENNPLLSGILMHLQQERQRKKMGL